MNTTILNREFKHPADGWYQVEAKGFHPCVGEQDGEEVNILQVIDDKAITSIVNRFNQSAAAGKLSQGSEMLIDREHFKDNPDKETVAYGWAKKMRVSPDGSGFDVEKPWTRTGQSAVDGGDYRFFSTEYNGPTETCFEPVPAAEIPTTIRNKYKDHIFLRPLELTGLTLTNAHNNKGQKAITITNRNTFAGSREPADSTANNKNQNKKMKTVCTLLGLSADADEQSVHAAVTKLLNRADVSATDYTKLQNRSTELETENQTLLGEQVDGILAEHKITDTKIVNRLKPVLTGLKDRADRVGYLTDCGFKPGVEKTTTRVLNRGTGAATQQDAGTDEQAAHEAEQKRATKIMNRAQAIQKDIPTISLATAVTMASKEIE